MWRCQHPPRLSWARTSLLFRPQEYESGRVVVPSLAEAVRLHRAPAPSDVQSAHTLLAAGASARRGVPPRPTPVAVSHERAAVAAAAGATLSASGKFETGAQRHFYMETQVGAHRATVAPCNRRQQAGVQLGWSEGESELAGGVYAQHPDYSCAAVPERS